APPPSSSPPPCYHRHHLAAPTVGAFRSEVGTKAAAALVDGGVGGGLVFGW
nr:hypothetical protein [Tanacetum cinerariifolium]